MRQISYLLVLRRRKMSSVVLTTTNKFKAVFRNIFINTSIKFIFVYGDAIFSINFLLLAVKYRKRMEAPYNPLNCNSKKSSMFSYLETDFCFHSGLMYRLLCFNYENIHLMLSRD